MSSYTRNDIISNEMIKRRNLFEKNMLIFTNYLFFTIVTESDIPINSFEYKERQLDKKWYQKVFKIDFINNKIIDIGILNNWLFMKNYFDNYSDSIDLKSINDCRLIF